MNLFRFVTGLVTVYMVLLAAVSGFAMVESIGRHSLQEAALALLALVGFLFGALSMGAVCWIEGRDG